MILININLLQYKNLDFCTRSCSPQKEIWTNDKLEEADICVMQMKYKLGEVDECVMLMKVDDKSEALLARSMICECLSS